jgi:hypothetical protein
MFCCSFFWAGALAVIVGSVSTVPPSLSHLSKGSKGALQMCCWRACLQLVFCFAPNGTFLAPFSESFVPSISPWMVTLAVILPIVIFLVSGSICLIKKLHREKEILSAEKKVEYEEREITRKELGKNIK